MTTPGLHAWDLVAVVVYFVIIIAVGIYSMCRSSRGTVEGYFLAGRYMNWVTVGASLFASNIGSEHFIGLAGAGAASGIAMLGVDMNTGIVLPWLGFVFLPVYIASGVCTLPEYMSKRFGGKRIRIYLASLSLLIYIFTKISVNLYSGGLFIQQALGWDMYPSVILVLSITGLLTVTGGLTAVIYTDTFQAVCMIVGAGVLAGVGYAEVGGYSGLHKLYPLAIPNTTLTSNSSCGLPKHNAFIMLRGPDDPVLPWPGFLFGQTLSSFWYWCADQMIVQRTLAAKSLSHAQGGTIFGGFLKLTPVFLIGIPGMISRALFPDEVGCVDPDVCWRVCRNRQGCSNIAYPKLVLELMPTGLKGVMLSVMLAALMSDLSSIFNSASTLFTMDVYKHIRKAARVRELMIVGRLFVLVLVVFSILWIPVIQIMQGGQLFAYMVSFNAAVGPSIAAVYFCAIFWKRANEAGAFWGLMVGMVIGMTRKICDVVYNSPACGELDERPFFVAGIHYMYYAIIVFWGTVLAVVIISLLTKHPKEEMLIRVTYWTRFDSTIREDECLSSEINERISIEPTDITTGEVITKEELELTVVYSEDSLHLTDGQIDSGSVDAARHSCKKALAWFCAADDASMRTPDHQTHIANIRRITSLVQSPKEKALLYTFLVTLVTCTTFLYVYFSFDGFGVYD